MTDRISGGPDNRGHAVTTDPVGSKTFEKTFLLRCRWDTIAAVRNRVAEFASRLPFDEDQLSDIRLAVGEALSNAYRHGCRDPHDLITVVCRAADEGLTVQVRDRGHGFRPGDVEMRGPKGLALGGKGIYFMRAMMDVVHFESGPTGTLVKMFKSVRTDVEADN